MVPHIAKYIPDRLFGFVSVDGDDLYFHLGKFDPKGPWPGLSHTCSVCDKFVFNWESPPPILGEPVEVTVTCGDPPSTKRIIRTVQPVLVHGLVEFVDHQHGYGFAKGQDGSMYHVHRSEMLYGGIPRVGSTVTFFAGKRMGQPRACHAHECK